MRYVPIDDLKWVFDVNVCGVVRTSQAFVPMLGADHERTGKAGKIINTVLKVPLRNTTRAVETSHRRW